MVAAAATPNMTLEVPALWVAALLRRRTPTTSCEDDRRLEEARMNDDELFELEEPWWQALSTTSPKAFCAEWLAHEGRQGPHVWVTMADPEGNEFCVSR